MRYWGGGIGHKITWAHNKTLLQPNGTLEADEIDEGQGQEGDSDVQVEHVDDFAEDSESDHGSVDSESDNDESDGYADL